MEKGKEKCKVIGKGHQAGLMQVLTPKRGEETAKRCLLSIKCSKSQKVGKKLFSKAGGGVVSVKNINSSYDQY